MTSLQESDPVADGLDTEDVATAAPNPVEDGVLAGKLREKEQLVAVLTERLERAAEQLDRSRRNGTDRGGRVVSAGMPPELLASQKQVLEDLGLAVERFEAAQAAETLGRIESQLGELRSIVISGGVGGGARGAAVGTDPSQKEGDLADSGDDVQSAWAAMKTRLLADDPAPVRESDSPSDRPDVADAIGTSPVPVESDVSFESIDPPASIDVDTADHDELAVALLARDEYIAHLLGRLRAKEGRGVPPIDWTALADSAPDDLRERLEQLEARLQETLRRAEIEQSLERARLGRVESELALRSERIEKELNRLGIDDDSRAQHEVDEAEKGPRWMRMLGLGKNDG